MADREYIAYLIDIKDILRKPSSAVQGNIATFGPNQTIVDSGNKPSDFCTPGYADNAVQVAASEIWNALKNEYAIAAYSAPAWVSGKTYIQGDFCAYGNAGYRCKTGHTSQSSFDATKWDMVLTVAGRQAITSMLSAHTASGKANLSDLAPAFDGAAYYNVGQLVRKDGVLQICVSRGSGSLATFSSDGATVERSISERLAALSNGLNKVEIDPSGTVSVTEPDGSNPIELVRKDNLAEDIEEIIGEGDFIAQDVIDAKFDKNKAGGYSIGDTCTHEGKFYVCISSVSSGQEWDASKWEETTVKEFVESKDVSHQADWNESDSSSPSFIRNKPEIPQIDATLTEQGYAADAKAAGDLIRSKAGLLDLPYKLVDLVSAPSDNPTIVKFNLQDRSANEIELEIDDNKTISLQFPSPARNDLARDFCVVFHVTSDRDIPVSTGVSTKDYAGNDVEIVAPANEWVTYRFTETALSGNVFLVTGYSDPAYKAVREISRALDDILMGVGDIGFAPSMYLPDQFGAYHKITLEKDVGTGEVNISVDNTDTYPDGTDGSYGGDSSDSGSGT